MSTPLERVEALLAAKDRLFPSHVQSITAAELRLAVNGDDEEES